MLIRNIKEFLKLTNNKKLMSLDIGTKKIGLALSDQKQLVVTPLKTINKNKLFLPNLVKIIQDFEIGGIIIGYPHNQNLKSKSCQMIRDVSKNISNFFFKNNFDLPIFFWDESYTSLEAEDLTKEFFKNTEIQKKKLDKYAAKIILDDFLNENLKVK